MSPVFRKNVSPHSFQRYTKSSLWKKSLRWRNQFCSDTWNPRLNLKPRGFHPGRNQFPCLCWNHHSTMVCFFVKSQTRSCCGFCTDDWSLIWFKCCFLTNNSVFTLTCEVQQKLIWDSLIEIIGNAQRRIIVADFLPKNILIQEILWTFFIFNPFLKHMPWKFSKMFPKK